MNLLVKNTLLARHLPNKLLALLCLLFTTQCACFDGKLGRRPQNHDAILKELYDSISFWQTKLPSDYSILGVDSNSGKAIFKLSKDSLFLFAYLDYQDFDSTYWSRGTGGGASTGTRWYYSKNDSLFDTYAWYSNDDGNEGTTISGFQFFHTLKFTGDTTYVYPNGDNSPGIGWYFVGGVMHSIDRFYGGDTIDQFGYVIPCTGQPWQYVQDKWQAYNERCKANDTGTIVRFCLVPGINSRLFRYKGICAIYNYSKEKLFKGSISELVESKHPLGKRYDYVDGDKSMFEYYILTTDGQLYVSDPEGKDVDTARVLGKPQYFYNDFWCDKMFFEHVN
jgi:hypothetical protein